MLVFEPTEQAWQQTSLEELAMRDDADLIVIPVYENGEQGESCTWAEYPRRQKQYALSQKTKTELEKEEKLHYWEKQKQLLLKKQQEESIAFKKKQEEESREVMATCIRRIAENIEAMKVDQLETNAKVRAVCIILLISWAIGAVGVIFGFLILNAN